MNYKAYVILFIATVWLHPCGAITKKNQNKVTQELITNSKEKFTQFLEQQEENYKKLESWTDPGWWLGSLVSATIEVVSPITRYGHIEPEKTKIFLGRAFEDIEKLKQAIDRLAQSEPNIAYLNILFNELPERDLKNKNLGKLTKTMIGKPHPGIKDTKLMGDKGNDGTYLVPDETFYLFAATNLFATFCVEEELFLQKTKKKHNNEFIVQYNNLQQ